MQETELNTFSIVGRCPRTGMLGVGISTKHPAVGAICPWARPRVGAIATQARTNPYLGIWGLELLAAGTSAQDTLEQLLARDEGREWRQLGVVDAKGSSAAFTGRETRPWVGHITGPDFAVQGNILVGEEVVQEMAQAFTTTGGDPLHERLMKALEAGQAAGGDRRGRQSAALYIVHTEDYPYLDLRVDDHPDPVAELRRILEIAKEELLPFSGDMPTKANPAGKLD